MRIRHLWLAAFVATVVFGLGISGCNKDVNRTAMRSGSPRSGQPVKPAEVLSASAYRPSARATMPLPPPATTYPEIYVASSSSSQYAMQVHPTPELVMAQSRLSTPEPIVYSPQVATARVVEPETPVFLSRVPIPELEPSRTYRLPTHRSSDRPVAEVMISGRQLPGGGDHQEAIRSRVPVVLAPVANPRPDWVASPITAMTTARADY